MASFLPGKFARFVAAGVSANGSFRWSPGFRRERLDVTTFESLVSASGYNVHSDGLTGVLDTTFQVESYITDTTVNLFFPDAPLACDLYYRKAIPLGYTGIYADVLEFTPTVSVRDRAMGTAQLQTSGLVSPAA